MTMYSLVKKGYGTYNEVIEFDTEQVLKMVEFENINSDIEHLVYEENKNS